MKTNTTLFWKLAVDYGAMQAGIRRINRNNNGYGPRETTLEALRQAAASEQTKVGGRP